MIHMLGLAFHFHYWFSFQPFLNMGEASNKIIGKLKVGSDTLATLEGHWDQEIYIRDRATGVGDDWEGVGGSDCG